MSDTSLRAGGVGVGSRVRLLVYLCGLLCVVLAGAFGPAAYAQLESDVTQPVVDPYHVDGMSLGGPIDLSSAWLLKQGDDPSYADPKLDDSHWLVVQPGRVLNTYGLQHVNFVWYRTHVGIPFGRHHLALLLRRFRGSQEVFVNGRRVESSGAFPPQGSIQETQNLLIPIPDALITSGELTIAVRGIVGRASFQGTNPAGFYYPGQVLLLGPAAVLADRASLFRFRDLTSNVTDMALAFIVLLISLALALTLRSDREYVALAIYLAAIVADDFLGVAMGISNAPDTLAWAVPGRLLLAIRLVALLEFSRLVLELNRSRLFVAYEWVITCFFILGGTYYDYRILLSPSGLSSRAVVDFGLAEQLIGFPVDAGLPLLALWIWWKRRKIDALLLSVPLMIDAAYQYYSFGQWALFELGLRRGSPNNLVPIHAFYVGWSEITFLLFIVALLLFLVLRTLRIARERTRAESEIKAAQTVQQVLLARSSERTPGYTVETVYLPASEVGGDFFVVSPGPDGSLTAIVGDVSGKGLIAAMRVSMILGVLRREESRAPATILSHLNDALLTQGEMGFTTACCVQLDRDGRFSVANAGHIAPYVAGREIETSPALPLGLAAHQEYDVVRGELAAGQTLVLLSDGVVEARSPKGELFGFERLPHLTRMAAQEIADVAQRFGQEDDITVLTIACSG